MSDGGIDTATFLVIVTAMGTAITGLSGLLWRERDLRSKAEVKLAGYEQSAPELVQAIREWIAASGHSSVDLPPSVDLPLPLPSSRTVPKVQRRKRPPA